MKKAHGYLRVSSRGQGQGDGPERQRKAIETYAQSHGFEIVEWFEDHFTGTAEDRPALARMMVDLEENGHGIKTVIVERLDRLARDLMVQEAILNDFQKNGFNLISTTEGADLLKDDPTRKLVRQVFGAIAEYDKSMLVLKLKAARDRKRARTGKCEGRKGLMESDQGKAIVARIKELRRKPRGGKRLSYSKCAEILNGEGMTTLAGMQWTPGNVQSLWHRYGSK